MKNINNFTQWKNGSLSVTFARAITHQKHLAQSGRSMQSAVDIFNTLRLFTKEPIREQEIISWNVWIENNFLSSKWAMNPSDMLAIWNSKVGCVWIN